MKWIIKHVWKSPISIGCYINIDNKENNTAVWSSTRPQLVKRYEGSSPKMAISQSVRSSCEIGSTLGILTVFLKTGFIFFGQQATNSFQSCSNLFKHKETYVFQSCLYSIQNRDPSSWRRSMASIVSVMFPGARRIYDEGTSLISRWMMIIIRCGCLLGNDGMLLELCLVVGFTGIMVIYESYVYIYIHVICLFVVSIILGWSENLQNGWFLNMTWERCCPNLWY